MGDILCAMGDSVCGVFRVRRPPDATGNREDNEKSNAEAQREPRIRRESEVKTQWRRSAAALQSFCYWTETLKLAGATVAVAVDAFGLDSVPLATLKS